jgi:hypothetical protein
MIRRGNSAHPCKDHLIKNKFNYTFEELYKGTIRKMRISRRHEFARSLSIELLIGN